MGFCCELASGCCGCPVRTTVCIALFQFIIYGIFVVSFVFSNICYPSYYYPDFIYGGSAAALIVMSFVTTLVVDLRNYLIIRQICALLVLLNVLTCVAGTYMYTIMRWDDIMVTALTDWLRIPPLKSFPDPLWFALTIMACIYVPVFLVFLIYIMSFLCNKWKSHLFTTPYQNAEAFSSLPPVLTIPQERYSSRPYKPYQVQRNDNTRN